MLPPAVEALVQAVNGPVAFDADGTLWRGDVGEALLEDLGPAAFAEYARRLATSPFDAYTWAVAMMQGLNERELLQRCRRVFARQEVFSFVRPLLARLSDVYIVSASPRWAVQAGAEALGVAPDRVIAVDCSVADGVLTGQVVTPIPCGEGKVAQLRARGITPVLAFGNGDLDQPMLEHAKAAVVVAPHGGPDNALVAAALRNRWPVLRA